MTDFRTQVSEALKRGLADELRRAMKRMRTARILARIEAIVQLRTARGEYLEGSSPDAGTYSEGHRRKREKKGLPTDRVDLFFDGRMTGAWRGRPRFEQDALLLESGYITGLSESEAEQLASYHNIEGAGTAHVKHIFVGLTDAEEDEVFDMNEREFLSGL